MARQYLTTELSDGRTFTTQVTNPDRIRWDMTAAKKKWPAPGDAPFLWLTFMCWAALRRQGSYEGTFEQFSEHDAIDVTATDEDGNPIDEDDEGESTGK